MTDAFGSPRQYALRDPQPTPRKDRGSGVREARIGRSSTRPTDQARIIFPGFVLSIVLSLFDPTSTSTCAFFHAL